jgi:hypothetical protein
MSLSDLKLSTPRNTAQDVTGFLRSPSSNAQINNERFRLLVTNILRPIFNDFIDGLEGNLTTGSVTIVNDLTTGGTDKALSAEQGKVLNTMIGDIATAIDGINGEAV